MPRKAKTPQPETLAAAYIRMSGRQQDKSPAEHARKSPNWRPGKVAGLSCGTTMRRSPGIAPPMTDPAWRRYWQGQRPASSP